MFWKWNVSNKNETQKKTTNIFVSLLGVTLRGRLKNEEIEKNSLKAALDRADR